MKLQAFSQHVFQKETPTQVRSCEVCETFKKTDFEDYLQTAGSVGVLLKSSFLKTVQYAQHERSQ